MKVGIYAGEIPPPIFINNLAYGLTSASYEVYLYGSSKNKKKYFFESNIKEVRFIEKKFEIIFYFIFYILKFFIKKPRKFLKAIKVIWINSKDIKHFLIRFYKILPPILDDLDIFHIQWTKTIIEYPDFFKLIDCPIILSMRGTQINVSPIVSSKISNLYKKYFSKIDAFHAVSELVLNETIKYGVEKEKISVIRPAVEDSLLNYKSNTISIKNNELLKIISVGRCHWVKGYSFALDTMLLLKNKGIDFHYTIVANGKDTENLTYQILDLELTKWVTFINGLEYRKVIRKIMESNLLFVPSIIEGIPNVVLEAMALNVPVISTKCGGINEVIKNKNNGIIIPQRDPVLMYEKIVEFINLDHKVKLNLIKNARETINQGYKLSDQIQQFKKLYSGVV